MRRALLVLSFAAVAAVPSTASATHTCVEISGAINTQPLLGDCPFVTGPEHNCQRLRTESLTIVICVTTVLYDPVN